MLRYLAQPRWIPWHLFCAAALAGCVYMAWWQWDVATAPAAPGVEVSVWRNYAYAVNWWIFAGVGVWFWWRLPRDQMRADQAREAAEAESSRGEGAAASAGGGASGGAGVGGVVDAGAGQPSSQSGVHGGRTISGDQRFDPFAD